MGVSFRNTQKLLFTRSPVSNEMSFNQLSEFIGNLLIKKTAKIIVAGTQFVYLFTTFLSSGSKGPGKQSFDKTHERIIIA